VEDFGSDLPFLRGEKMKIKNRKKGRKEWGRSIKKRSERRGVRRELRTKGIDVES
jgi:hypothetical protein